MKNDCRIYELKRKPEGSESHEDHHTRLVEYDDWMRQEEKKYSRLLDELNKSYWLAQYNAGKLKNNVKDSVSYDENLLLESEETRLNSDEIRCDCDLTLEDAILEHQEHSMFSPDESLDKNSSQQSIMFQCNLSLNGNISYSSIAALNKNVLGDAPEQDSNNFIPWDSILIESGRLILCLEKADRLNSKKYIQNEYTENRKIVYTFHSDNAKDDGE